MLGKTTNPLLQQTEQAIQAKIQPQYQNAFQRTVTAGLTIMYSPQSHQITMAQLTKPGDPAHNVSEGAAKLVGILYKQSKNTMPIQIMAPAAMIFMCEGLGFLEQSGKLQVNPQILSSATHDTAAYVLKLMGVSQQQMHTVIAHGRAQKEAAAGPQSTPQAPVPPTPPQSGGIISGAMQGAQ